MRRRRRPGTARGGVVGAVEGLAPTGRRLPPFGVLGFVIVVVVLVGVVSVIVIVVISVE